jgi:phosphatidylinositol kinase/protein kinase (PI-3  family)
MKVLVHTTVAKASLSEAFGQKQSAHRLELSSSSNNYYWLKALARVKQDLDPSINDTASFEYVN